ncbi:hypothetical protein DFJ77DRAFT_439360 [Powellomyces hirtus]|nr:hypothetical protein DFJ77DRAFT_439360 [Powellomyces hirtus]
MATIRFNMLSLNVAEITVPLPINFSNQVAHGLLCTFANVIHRHYAPGLFSGPMRSKHPPPYDFLFVDVTSVLLAVTVGLFLYPGADAQQDRVGGFAVRSPSVGHRFDGNGYSAEPLKV